MSGGSYDYAYCKVRDLGAEIIGRAAGEPHEALRIAFGKHLVACADAARAIELVDSSDWGAGDEVKPIQDVLPVGAEIAAALALAETARLQLEAALERASK